MSTMRVCLHYAGIYKNNCFFVDYISLLILTVEFVL